MNAGRGKPLSVNIVISDPALDATLRALSLVEQSTIRKEARRLLEGALQHLYENNEQLRDVADNFVGAWVEAGLIDKPTPDQPHLRLVK